MMRQVGLIMAMVLGMAVEFEEGKPIVKWVTTWDLSVWK